MIVYCFECPCDTEFFIKDVDVDTIICPVCGDECKPKASAEITFQRVRDLPQDKKNV